MITYETEGNPTKTGVYACRVPNERMAPLQNDLFLMWVNGGWSHIGSDQKYRGEVDGWIGPLQRRVTPPQRTKEPA